MTDHRVLSPPRRLADQTRRQKTAAATQPVTGSVSTQTITPFISLDQTVGLSEIV
ncbi:hypothetical protein HKD27_09490 [Gluconobacter sp. R75690]|uniref:hypothetical protein n=1 Tax=Gluconobacter TaxID=441 RepID=UPI00188B0771|nr:MULTISPECIES: hypothetical protein [unclassified Gluconobacter]MBF0851151.1 hypothetical protein [Gluconobacter sp. R75690]MBF0879843.1 hypothetical protein [Gluconobacter sp. R75828]